MSLLIFSNDICFRFKTVLKLVVSINIFTFYNIQARNIVDDLYRVRPGTKVKDGYVISMTPGISKFDCVLLCQKEILCQSVSYRSNTRDCILSYVTAKTPNVDIQNEWISLSKSGAPTDCEDVFNRVSATTSGVYTVYVSSLSEWVSVYCDLETDGGGWTAFQRRHNGLIDFNQGFAMYESGFGNPNTEFWLGLHTLYAMTNGLQNELRIEFTDFTGDLAIEQYEQFNIGQGPLYQLALGDVVFFNTTQATAYTGTPGSSSDMDQTEICQFMTQTLAFSTEWDTGDYSADQVLGPPDVYPAYGDLVGAWCPGNDKTANDYLEYRFATPIRITNVTVFETYEVGSLTRIASRDFAGQWVTLWSTSAIEKLTESRTFSPNLYILNELTTDIRLEMDLSSSWYEIDAIEVCGSTNINPFQTMKYNDGMGFTTMDNDVDSRSGNCANSHKGGWWFDDCTSINPNGEYTANGSVASMDGLGGMIVPGWKGVNTVQSSKLMFRRKNSP